MSGKEPNTTNNRMELTAVIKALEALKKPCTLKIFTDSKYVVDSINKGWAEKWQQHNWITSNKKKVLNPDLWQKLLSLLEPHKAEFIWVKGHSGHPENELCDRMAVAEYRKLIGR